MASESSAHSAETNTSVLSISGTTDDMQMNAAMIAAGLTADQALEALMRDTVPQSSSAPLLGASATGHPSGGGNPPGLEDIQMRNEDKKAYQVLPAAKTSPTRNPSVDAKSKQAASSSPRGRRVTLSPQARRFSRPPASPAVSNELKSSEKARSSAEQEVLDLKQRLAEMTTSAE